MEAIGSDFSQDDFDKLNMELFVLKSTQPVTPVAKKRIQEINDILQEYGLLDEDDEE